MAGAKLKANQIACVTQTLPPNIVPNSTMPFLEIYFNHGERTRAFHRLESS